MVTIGQKGERIDGFGGDVCLLAGSWRTFTCSFLGGYWGSQRPYGHYGTCRSWIWTITGRWNQTWWLPLQPVWSGFDVYAGSTIAREESLGPGHVYSRRQVQLPVLFLCFCIQAQVSLYYLLFLLLNVHLPIFWRPYRFTKPKQMFLFSTCTTFTVRCPINIKSIIYGWQ